MWLYKSRGGSQLKKILILSAENTGHGHKSITRSLCEQYKLQGLDVELHEYDSFQLGGIVTRLSGRLYNKLAVYAPNVWGFIYKAGDLCPRFVNYFVSFRIHKSIMKLINEVKPDLILSVHSCFVGSVINVLERKNLNIPLISFVADFDNVSYLWADKRSAYTLCPTENAKRTMLSLGVPEDKIKIFGFPARDRFNHFNEKNDEAAISVYEDKKGPLRFMIMNGSQGTSRALEMAKQLLKNEKSFVTIIAGRSKVIKKIIEEALEPNYSGRYEVLGFVENVEEYMLKSDILVLRASPNVVTEAVNLCRPIIVTGALKGQEEKNPQFILDNNLGIVCTDVKKLPEAVDLLLKDNCKKIKEIYQSQLAYRKPSAAKDIAEFVYKAMEEN